MMHFDCPAEPADFDTKVRQPGNAWLSAHPGEERPRDFWSPFKSDLANGFFNLCAYSALFVPVGTVDHFYSCKSRRDLTYEWTNYRFAAQWINSAKQDDDNILDPFVVKDDWFEILLPSLQLVMTDAIPAEFRERAQYTIRKLHIQDDERIMRQRYEWYISYLQHDITLEYLKRKAPLIARAVEKENNT